MEEDSAFWASRSRDMVRFRVHELGLTPKKKKTMQQNPTKPYSPSSCTVPMQALYHTKQQIATSFV